MKKRRIVARILSLMLVLTVMTGILGVMPICTIKANESSSANSMGSAMLNFFQTANSIEDVTKLTPDEIRVYATFISNFMKPGVFKLSDLNGGVDSDIVKAIYKFFGGSSTSGDSNTLNTIVNLNKLVYEGLRIDLNNVSATGLYEDSQATKRLTGRELLRKMTFCEGSDSKIYFSSMGNLCMDLTDDAFRGAFKLLGAYSIELFFSAKGICNMSALSIDGYGNIWGAYTENLNGVEGKKLQALTSTDGMILVMPACINPLAFTPVLSGTSASNVTFKLPLVNAYAMGAFVEVTDIDSAFSKNIVPYYNLYDYISNSTDKKNILNIYGIMSATGEVGNTDIFLEDADDKHNLETNLTKELTKFYEEDGVKTTGTPQIVLANNLTCVEKSLTKLVQKFMKEESNAEIHAALYYLYDTCVIPLSKCETTMYYFSSLGSESWENNTFSDLGLVGASMFMDSVEDNTFYSSTTLRNGTTNMLQKFFTALAQNDISLKDIIPTNFKTVDEVNKCITPEVLTEIYDAAKILKTTVDAYSVTLDEEDCTYHDWPTELTGKDASLEYCEIASPYVDLAFLLNSMFYSEMDKGYYDAGLEYGSLTQDKINACLSELWDESGYSDDINGTYAEGVEVLYEIHPYLSAIFYLMGLSEGAYMYEYIGGTAFPIIGFIPRVLAVGDLASSNKKDKDSPIKKQEVRYSLGSMDADTSVAAKISVDSFLCLDTGDKTYISGLDIVGDNCLYNNVIESVWTCTMTRRTYSQGVYATTNMYTLFGSFGINVSGTQSKTEVSCKSGDESITDSIYTLTVNNQLADEGNNWPGIFWGYMVSILSMKEATEKETQKNNDGETHFDIWSFDSPYLPVPTIKVVGGKLDLTEGLVESGVSRSDETSLKQMQENLLRSATAIIDNNQNTYRNSWIRSTVNGIILSLHNSIVGGGITKGIQSVSSGGNYQSVVGFLYTPSLDELPFTSWFMTNYMYIYIVLMLFLSVALLGMALLNMRTARQAVVAILILGVALLLPNILLGNTINITNAMVDKMYSTKFDFWAMVQHQQSLSKLSSASNKREEAILSTFNKADTMYSSDLGVRIKWMSPKKSSTFNDLYTNTNMTEDFATNLTLFKWLFSSFIYESEYTSDSLSTYLYRPYNAIVLTAKENYEMCVKSLAAEADKHSMATIKFRDAQDTMYQAYVDVPDIWGDLYKKSKVSTANFVDSKMLYAGLTPKKLFTETNNYAHLYYGASVNDAKFKDIEAVDTFKYNNAHTSNNVALWGTMSDKVNDVIFNEAELFDGVNTDVGVESNLGEDIAENMTVSEGSNIAYLLNTESPFYYFYNVLKYRYEKNSFSEALLSEEVFKVKQTDLQSTNVRVNGVIRDFLDMKGLFTYLVPYLTMSNNYVYDWTSKNGKSVEGFDFENGTDEGGCDSFEYQKAKKLALSQVWNMYSPWVDQLNTLAGNNVRVYLGKKKVTIYNQLNPSYYLLAGREMVFSEADMKAHGLAVANLTDIERRIQNVLSETYTDMMYLLNYYDMSDEVLISAAAMYATFNFNSEFSQNNVVGENINLYPQSFEMKNFNHDAFLRLAMLNATGESVFSKTDIFETILNKTSWVTGLLMLLEDLLAQIGIPLLKLIDLLLLLFLGFLVCTVSVLQPSEKLVSTILKSFVLPVLIFTAATVIFGFVVSLLVGNGLSAYVGANTITITTNDPTLTLALMLIADIIYSYVLFRILKMVLSSCKNFGSASLFAAIGVATGIVAGAAKKATRVATNATKGGLRVGGKIVKGGAYATGGAIVGGVMDGKEGAINGALEGMYGKNPVRLARAEMRMRRGEKRYTEAMQESIRNALDGKGTSQGEQDANKSTVKESGVENTQKVSDVTQSASQKDVAQSINADTSVVKTSTTRIRGKSRAERKLIRQKAYEKEKQESLRRVAKARKLEETKLKKMKAADGKTMTIEEARKHVETKKKAQENSAIVLLAANDAVTTTPTRTGKPMGQRRVRVREEREARDAARKAKGQNYL